MYRDYLYIYICLPHIARFLTVHTCNNNNNNSRWSLLKSTFHLSRVYIVRLLFNFRVRCTHTQRVHLLSRNASPARARLALVKTFHFHLNLLTYAPMRRYLHVYIYKYACVSTHFARVARARGGDITEQSLLSANCIAHVTERWYFRVTCVHLEIQYTGGSYYYYYYVSARAWNH